MAFGRGNLAGGQYYIGDVVKNSNLEPFYEKKLTDKYTVDTEFKFTYNKQVHDSNFLYMYVEADDKVYKYSMEEYKIVDTFTIPFKLNYFRIYVYEGIIEYGNNSTLYRVKSSDFSIVKTISLSGLDYNGTPKSIYYLNDNRVMSISYYSLYIHDLQTKQRILSLTNDGRDREIKIFNNAMFYSKVSGDVSIYDFNGTFIQNFSSEANNRYFNQFTELADGSLVCSTDASDNSVGGDRSAIITPDGNKFKIKVSYSERLRGIAEYDGFIYGHDYHVLYKHDRNFNRLQQWDLPNRTNTTYGLIFGRKNLPTIYNNNIYSFYNVVQTGYKIIN